MDRLRLKKIVDALVALPRETEWVEFKQNYAKPEEIGERISALANGACLKNKSYGYLVFGIKDESREVVGTNTSFLGAKKGNEELQHWLLQRMNPRPLLEIYEDIYGEKNTRVPI